MLAVLGGSELILIILFVLLIPFFAFMSVLFNKFNGNEKILWLILIIVIPFFGAFLYFLIGRRKRIK
jgi:hypothetical protein